MARDRDPLAARGMLSVGMARIVAGGGEKPGPFLDTVNSVVQAIFSVSLQLSTSGCVTGRPTSAGLLAAIDDLDAIVDHLQQAALDYLCPVRRTSIDLAPADVALADALRLLEQAGGRLSCVEVEAVIVQMVNAYHGILRAMVDPPEWVRVDVDLRDDRNDVDLRTLHAGAVRRRAGHRVPAGEGSSSAISARWTA